jgi:hypothetical protein
VAVRFDAERFDAVRFEEVLAMIALPLRVHESA